MLEKRIKILSIVAIAAITITMISFYGGIDIFADADLDGVPDSSDNCPNASNPIQRNYDLDNLGDLCDSDDDNDKVPDTEDAFDNDPTEWADFDSDNIGDNTDVDDDNDGVIDESDAFDTDPTEWSDFDSDSIGDNADTDDDNDKIVDTIDAFDNDPTEWADFDFDGVGSNQDTDDDNDGILDVTDPTPVLPTEQLAEEYLKEIQDCALADSEKLSTSCYSQLFQKIIKQEESNSEPVELSVALSKLGAIDDCHFTTHAMAHAAFEENPDVIEILTGVDSTVCRGAFYHGSIMSYFNTLKDNGKSDPISYMELCNTFYGTPNYQDCVHGLGHGFVLFFSDELKPAVETCNQMSFYQNELCIGGVMMQYTADQINEYGTTSENLSKMCPESELSSLDYQQCAISMGIAFGFRSFHNFEVGSKFCELIEDEKAEKFCLQGLESEIEDSKKYKVAPLTQETREMFQPQIVQQGSQEWIVDVRSPATVSGFSYTEVIKLMQFFFDEPAYIIMYIPNDLLPNKVVVTVNGQVPNDIIADSKSIEGYTVIQIVPKNSGVVIISGIE